MEYLFDKDNDYIIKWLQKQRDGIIIGDYRNMLYHTYQKICTISQSHRCSLTELRNEMPEHIQKTNQIMELCQVLNTLGYINIFYENDNTFFSISKTIDF